MDVRSTSDHYNEPKLYCTQGAINFFQEVLKVDPRDLALRFEAWVLNKLHTVEGECGVTCRLSTSRSQLV